MRRAVTLPTPLRLGEASHHLLNKSTRATLAHPPAGSFAASPSLGSGPSTPILRAPGSATYRTSAIIPTTPGPSTPTPQSPVWKITDSEVTPTFNSPPLATLRAAIEPKSSIIGVAKAINGYPWVSHSKTSAKPLPHIPIPHITPQNALQVQGLGDGDTLIDLPRTFLGEPVKDLFEHGASQKLKASQPKRREASNSIDNYIAYARIGQTNRHGLGEKDPWLDSLLIVKLRFTEMDEAGMYLTRARKTHPTLMPLIDDAVEAIDALKKQTIEFYRDAYSKWWARVPAPPETPTQSLKIARAICEGKHGSVDAIASFLIGLVPRIDAERELFCEFRHPSHGLPFTPPDSPSEKSVRFVASPLSHFTPLPFAISRRAQMINTLPPECTAGTWHPLHTVTSFTV